jgi:glycosyltransferase involved in cell wall biosynthesis
MRIGLLYFDALQDGGYPRDVRSLAGALADRRMNVSLIAHQGDHLDLAGSANVVSPSDWRGLVKRLDVLHTFGVFAGRQLTMHRRLKPAVGVVSPLGHLMEAHIRRRSWRKYLYLSIARRMLFPPSATYHLFSEVERSGVVRHTGSTRWFEATLGIYSPPSSEPEREIGPDHLLFFGRNDIYQKGLDMLIASYARARQRGLGLPLVIAGAPHADSTRVISRLIKEHGLRDTVTILGPVPEARKWALLRHATALVFLSRWDGPPRPIREALSVGTPVIVSPGTNLAGLVSRSCAGQAVSFEREAIADGMLAAEDDFRLVSWREGASRLGGLLDWHAVADTYLVGYHRALAASQA